MISDLRSNSSNHSLSSLGKFILLECLLLGSLRILSRLPCLKAITNTYHNLNKSNPNPSKMPTTGQTGPTPNPQTNLKSIGPNNGNNNPCSSRTNHNNTSSREDIRGIGQDRDSLCSRGKGMLGNGRCSHRSSSSFIRHSSIISSISRKSISLRSKPIRNHHNDSMILYPKTNK